MCVYCELKEPLDTWGEMIIDEKLDLGILPSLYLTNAINLRSNKLELMYFFAGEGNEFNVSINYCPMCGRKLLSVEEHMTIGENIRRIRRERGLTLKQLGEAVGVSEAYIRAYEKGRRYPKYKSLVKIAKALDVSVDVFSGIMLAEANEKDRNNG